MSDESGPETSAAPRTAELEAPLRLFATAPAIRKGRFIALLLLVNWAVMGIYVLSQGIRSLVGGLAFALGLFALVGGLTYLRAARAASTLPLIEIEDGRIRYRRFSSTEPATLDLRAIGGIEERSRDAVTVLSTGGDRTAIPWLALSDADRVRLEERLDGRTR